MPPFISIGRRCEPVAVFAIHHPELLTLSSAPSAFY
jgi:hypothetical protein